MYAINDDSVSKIEDITFSELGLLENNIEEILRKNIDMVCDEEDSFLLVGQQVANEVRARSDLIAIDQDGNLVLIEIKRDRQDMEARKEPLEFQAIRYAASCATIQTTDDLIQSVFAPYVEKHRNEFGFPELSSVEVANRVLSEFLTTNSITTFNAHQRIILVASDFDDQTLSAVAWLNSNDVDIACFRLVPYKVNEMLFIDPKKLLPVTDLEDYYIEIKARSSIGKKQKRDITRRSLPKISALLEWGVVNAGDMIIAKGHPDEAVLNADGSVTTDAGKASMQKWLKTVYGWSSVETYKFAVQKSSGKTLALLRQEYMEQLAAAEDEMVLSE